jgi:hypothetical protein
VQREFLPTIFQAYHPIGSITDLYEDKPIDDREGSIGGGTISGTGWALMVKSSPILSIAAPASFTEQATSYEAHPWKSVRISH